MISWKLCCAWLEVEIDQEPRAQADDALSAEGDEIALGEQPAMMEEMRRAHQLAIA